jgi:hypothetical protein
LPDRPIVRVGLFGLQLRASVLPAGMLASAIVQCCLRKPYTSQPAPAVLADVLAGNLNALRRIAARKTVALPCLAGVRGVHIGPGQASLETALGTLHSPSAFHAPELAMRSNPDVLVTTTIRTQIQVSGRAISSGDTTTRRWKRRRSACPTSGWRCCWDRPKRDRRIYKIGHARRSRASRSYNRLR